MEVSILIWVLIGAGVTAGVFLIARAVVEVGAVAYAYVERNISRNEAMRRGGVLMAGAAAALAATALIFGIAVLALFAIALSQQFGQ